MKVDRKRKKSIFLRLALLAFSIYVIVMLLQLQMELGASQRQLDNYDQDVYKRQAVESSVNVYGCDILALGRLTMQQMCIRDSPYTGNCMQI